MGKEKDMKVDTKPIEATGKNFMTDKEYERITEIIRNPAKPSDFVKEVMNNYQKMRQEK